MTPQQAMLQPTRYEFSYRNDFNDKYGADRDECPDGEYVLLADVQEAIDFWNRRAPAPTEPAVDRDSIVSDFSAWLAREMPPGTVIGDPAWWARKIVSRLATPASPAAPDYDIETLTLRGLAADLVNEAVNLLVEEAKRVMGQDGGAEGGDGEQGVAK